MANLYKSKAYPRAKIKSGLITYSVISKCNYQMLWPIQRRGPYSRAASWQQISELKFTGGKFQRWGKDVAGYLPQNGNLPVPQSLFLLLHIPPFSTHRADVQPPAQKLRGSPGSRFPLFKTFQYPFWTQSLLPAHTHSSSCPVFPKWPLLSQKSHFTVFPMGESPLPPASAGVPMSPPVRWPGHGTCRSLKLFLICPELRRKLSLEKLSLRWICGPFTCSHSSCHPARSCHPMKAEWNSALRTLWLRMKIEMNKN